MSQSPLRAPGVVAAARDLVDTAEKCAAAGDGARALMLFDAASTGPFAAFAALRSGQILAAAGELAAARRALERAARLKPGDAPILVALGNVLERSGERRDAVACFRRAQRAAPRAAAPVNNLALIFRSAGKYDAAARICARAIARGVDRRQLAEAIGLAALDHGSAALAETAFRDAIAADPARAELRVGLAEALIDLGRPAAAIAELHQAIAQLRAPAQARLNLAYALFLAGDWRAAWRAFEARLAPDAPLRSMRRAQSLTLPAWTGARDEGPVFVWSEQGIGDEVLFASLLDGARAHGVEIVLECDPRLVPLFERSFPAVEILARRAPPLPPPASCRSQLAAGSLGHVLEWTPHTHAPHACLRADATRAAELRRRLAPVGQRLLGVSWASRNRELGRAKTLPLDAVATLAALPGTVLVDLQYGDTRAARAALAARHGVVLARVPELDLHDDLDGLAALIAACDGVVSISNVTAHLAGALGVATHVLVPRGRGRIWYWLDGDGASVWYPRVRLYPQGDAQDWSAALAAIARALTPPIR